jgi:hypothetical protein
MVLIIKDLYDPFKFNPEGVDVECIPYPGMLPGLL